MRAGKASAEPSRHEDPCGSETILLVEDEPQVLDLFKRILEACGYRVLAAGDGETALRLSQRHQGEVHLAIVDVVMPLMGGHEVVRQMAPTHPAMKVIYMSGYSRRMVAGQIDPDAVYIQKPVTVGGLARRVREVLDAPQPAR
ncbi:MAG: response regulator [Planctomycetota bacterium]